MKTIQKWAVALFLFVALACVNSVSAQRIFSKEEMVGLDRNQLNKFAVIHHLKKHCGIEKAGNDYGKGIESSEGRLAFTLFKSLQSSQLKDIKAALQAMDNKGSGEFFDKADAPQKVKCSILTYDDFWEWAGLCTP
jgi:hypothetical protein